MIGDKKWLAELDDYWFMWRFEAIIKMCVVLRRNNSPLFAHFDELFNETWPLVIERFKYESNPEFN